MLYFKDLNSLHFETACFTSKTNCHLCKLSMVTFGLCKKCQCTSDMDKKTTLTKT